MKAALSEKQWAAIIAVGWVLVSVHASMANSIPSGHFGEGGKVLMTVDKVYQNGLKTYANLGRFGPVVWQGVAVPNEIQR